ncbi:MAG: hypothetical protein HFI16_14975 [Lachnospiraceae bacterium]|nr:hypothetical protein [Lachnospiraceae bacterium]
MAENQDVIEVEAKQLNNVTTGVNKTVGETTYKILGADLTAVVEGKIIFKARNKEGTTYYTGKELPLYNGETKCYVDEQGLMTVEINGGTLWRRKKDRRRSK